MKVGYFCQGKGESLNARRRSSGISSFKPTASNAQGFIVSNLKYFVEWYLSHKLRAIKTGNFIMVNPFTVYKNYPFKISTRVRFFDLFRYIFTIPLLENLLVSRLEKRSKSWSRLIPPLYFYQCGSFREAKRDGINYRLDISCLLDHSIYFHNLNEPNWHTLFSYLQQDFVVFDIGANIGFLTLNFAKKCPGGFVFSFEPDTDNFSALQHNVLQNNFKNICIFRNALGAKSESAHLYKLYVNNPGANRILPEKPDKPYQVENVEVLALDDLVERMALQRIDMVKIDVEGFEIFVLKGSQKVIKKWKPILFVELSEKNLRQQGYSASALIEFVGNMGYEIKDARTMQAVDRLNKDHNTDILCLPIPGV
jgi:FkbM family methyltransferase